MKKASALAMCALAALLAVTGCKSINTSDAGNMTLNPSVSGPIDRYRPLYQVDEAKTVQGNAKIHSILGIFVWGGDGIADFADMTSESEGFFAKWLPDAKKIGAKSAFYDACVKNNCDSVVASRYTIKTTDYVVYAQYNINIKGYPAKQTGIETIKTIPYYVEPATGKIVVLDKFVDMVNVGPTTARTSTVGGVKKTWFIF